MSNQEYTMEELELVWKIQDAEWNLLMLQSKLENAVNERKLLEELIQLKG